MSRYSTYGNLDTRETADGDTGFTGLDMVRERDQLPPGMMHRSENKRCRDRRASTRKGTDMPGDFNPDFNNPLIGSATYNNPNGDLVILVATANAGYVWVLQFGKDPVKVNLSGGNTTGAGLVFFSQAFDKVVLFRVPTLAQPLMVWDGITGHTFDPMVLSGSGTLVPARWQGQPFKDRIMYYSPYFAGLPDRDQVIMSDSGNLTSYDSVLAVFRINSGESDMIVRVWPYFRQRLVIFKQWSIHILQNFTQDPTFAEQRMISSARGAAGNRAIVEDGNRVLFLSEPSSDSGGGIYSLDEVIEEQITAEPAPISEPIQPVIDRINWPFARVWACAVTLDIYSIFFVPLDNAVYPNAAMVYNNMTRQWESIDTWADPNFGIQAVHLITYDGKRRLFGLDYANSRVYLLYEGVLDLTGGDVHEIPDVMETRGYSCGDPTGFKRFQRAQMAVATFNPSIDVTAISDGYNEEQLLTETGPITKDRTRFYPHGHDDYVQDVTDPNEPLREDYSLEDLEEFVAQDYEALDVGNITSVPGTPPPATSPKQQSLERLSVRQNGRWLSLRIENSQGACDVLAISVEAVPVLETMRTVA